MALKTIGRWFAPRPRFVFFRPRHRCRQGVSNYKSYVVRRQEASGQSGVGETQCPTLEG